jgi:hypothetical protein
MKKQDITPEEAYEVRAPSEYSSRGATVKATVVEVGVGREPYGRASKRLDGVRVRLEEPWEVSALGEGLKRITRTMRPGEEFVVSTAEVVKPADEGTEEQLRERAVTRAIIERARGGNSRGSASTSARRRIASRARRRGRAMCSGRIGRS